MKVQIGLQIGQIGLQIGLLLPVLSLHTSYTSYTICNMQTNWQHQLRKIDLKPENSQQEKPVTLVCSEKRKSGWQDLFLTHVTNPDEWEDTLSQPVLEYWKLGLGAVYFCTVKTFFPDFKIWGGRWRTNRTIFKAPFDPCVNTMGQRPYWLSCMEVCYCTFGFGVIIRHDLRTLSLPCDSPRDKHCAYVI